MPTVAPRELPVRWDRCWCQSVELEAHLSLTMHVDNFEVFMMTALVQIAVQIPILAYSPRLAVINLCTSLPLPVCRGWTHGWDRGSGEAAVRACLRAFQLACLLRVLMVLAILAGKQPAGLMSIDDVKTFPLFTPFLMAMDTVLVQLLVTMSVPTSSPRGAIERVLPGVVWTAMEAVTLSRSARPDWMMMPIAGLICGLAAARLYEHTQRTHMLKLMQLQEQLQRPPKADAEQKQILSRVLRAQSLPSLVLQVRSGNDRSLSPDGVGCGLRAAGPIGARWEARPMRQAHLPLPSDHARAHVPLSMPPPHSGARRPRRLADHALARRRCLRPGLVCTVAQPRAGVT